MLFLGQIKISSADYSKFEFLSTLSILLMKAILGTKFLSAWRQTVNVWASTPADPSRMTMPPSRTLQKTQE
jgi:hypothetical protein